MKRSSPLWLALIVVATSGCSTCKKDQGGSASTSSSTASNAEPSSKAPSDDDKPTAVHEASRPITDFKPATNGFGFQNYGNGPGPVNLTPVEVHRMFGDAVCSELKEGRCTLVPQGEQWMEEVNRAMGGGHCEGMAVLSLLFERGQIDPAMFGAPLASGLELKGNDKLQREIAYWWTTQVSPSVRERRLPMTPVEVVAALRDAFKKGDDTYTLAFFQRDFKGGHATTPYAVVDHGDDVVWIMHYDNNYPSKEAHIDVDLKANTWKYVTASNPDEPEAAYEGDESTKTLMIAPTSARTGKQECTFCGDFDTTGASPTTGSVASRPAREISADGADIVITDEAGKRLGYVGGKLVNEIPGGSFAPRLSSSADDFDEPVFYVPAGVKLTVAIDGSSIKSDTNGDVMMVGAGYAVGVEGIALHVGQQDEIELSADGSEIRYVTKQNETPLLTVAVQTTGADYLFEVHVDGDTAGQSVDLALDVKAGVFAVRVSGGDGKSEFTIDVHKLDASGEQVFAHKGVALTAAEIVAFDYGSWKGDKAPMHVTMKDDKGTKQSEQDVSDED